MDISTETCLNTNSKLSQLRVPESHSRVLVSYTYGCFYAFKYSINWKIKSRQGCKAWNAELSSSLLQKSVFKHFLLKETFQLTVAVRLMPPLSFFLKPILGGLLFRRIPNPSSSFSMIFLWPRGFSTSRTIRMRLQVRATENQKS